MYRYARIYAPPEPAPLTHPPPSSSSNTKWLIIGAIGCLGLPAVLVCGAIVIIGILTLLGGKVSEVFSSVDSGLETSSLEAPPFTKQGNNTSSTQQLAPVLINDLAPYTHPSGLFAINTPTNWTTSDSSFQDEIIINFSDPYNNGGIVVDIFEDDSMTDQELANTLTFFTKDSFQNMPAFAIEEPIISPTGGVWLTFSYNSEVQGTHHPMIGRSFISRTNNKVTLISYLVPAQQFAELTPAFENIISSYQLDTTVRIE